MDQASYHPLKLMGNIRFDIAIETEGGDPICQAIADQTFAFPAMFSLAFELLHPGGAVIDLGAHVGTFSLAAAALGCKVVSVEASPHNADLLNASVRRNNFNRIQVIAAAVSDYAGTAQFVQGGPFGCVSNPIMPSASVEVPSVTVDGLLAELGWRQVDLIKMDVEGSEVAAIRGMSRLLARADAPPIVYESNGHTLRFFGETPQRLIAALEQFGYKSYLVEPGRLVPVQSGDLQPECNVDYLAIKQLPDNLTGWQVASPMAQTEILDKVLSSCGHVNERHRAYIARALAEASHSILSDRRVMSALRSLRADPNADVRAAAAWLDRDPVESIIRAARFESLKSQADIMLRGYAVRSNIPLVGGLIAWLRKNLTSHLRELYVDPIFERQVEFNRRLAREIHENEIVQAEILQRLAYLEARNAPESVPSARDAGKVKASVEDKTRDAA